MECKTLLELVSCNTHSAMRLGGSWLPDSDHLPGFSIAITLAFLHIFGMECVAMIREKYLESQMRGSSGIPHGS